MFSHFKQRGMSELQVTIVTNNQFTLTNLKVSSELRTRKETFHSRSQDSVRKWNNPGSYYTVMLLV